MGYGFKNPEKKKTLPQIPQNEGVLKHCSPLLSFGSSYLSNKNKSSTSRLLFLSLGSKKLL